MPSPIKMRTDYSAPQLRVLAKSAKTNSQSRRLLSLAAVLDGMNRTDAARIGGMDRQTLQDWVHRFNQLGPDGLCDLHAGGVEPRLSADQKAELAALVDAGPDLSVEPGAGDAHAYGHAGGSQGEGQRRSPQTEIVKRENAAIVFKAELEPEGGQLNGEAAFDQEEEGRRDEQEATKNGRPHDAIRGLETARQPIGRPRFSLKRYLPIFIVHI